MLQNYFLEVAKATHKTEVFDTGKAGLKKMKLLTLVQALRNL